MEESRTTEKDNLVEEDKNAKKEIESLAFRYVDVRGSKNTLVEQKISEILSERMGLTPMQKVNRGTVPKKRLGKPMKSVSGNRKEESREKESYRKEERREKEANILEEETDKETGIR